MISGGSTRIRTKALLVIAGAAAMVGCATPTPPLYLWGDFPKFQYEALRANGPPSAQRMVDMETHMQKAAAAHAALPPGFRAHLGMLKLGSGDAGQARALWQAEKAAFPESAPYMDQLLKRLDTPATQDKPA